MQFWRGSSSQKNSHQGGSSNPELDSKVLPSVRRLGKGLSGYLYETTWEGKKYVRKDFPLGSVHHDVFKKEAIALLVLDHPNIVRCPHYAVGKSSCSLLLEYVDDDLQNIIQKKVEAQGQGNRTGSSTTLHSRLLDIDETRSLMSSMAKRREITGADVGLVKMPENELTAPFEVPEAVDIISEIATGIKYLHDSGIVHGDLKPQNVLVGNDGIVKLVDFGLVETKKRIKLVSKRTRHFEILMWKAPERFEKLLGPVTEDSDDPFTDSDTDSDEEIESSVIFAESRLAMADVYSFGLVCSQVLGGKLMYSNLSLTQLREQRMHGFRPQLPSTCPDGLRLLIFSSVEREPLCRPTFTDICTALKAFQSNQLPRLMEAEGKKARSIAELLRPLLAVMTSETGDESWDNLVDTAGTSTMSPYILPLVAEKKPPFYEVRRIARGEEVTFGSARGGRGLRVLVTAVRFALRLRAKSVMEKRKKTEMKRIQEPGACKRMSEVRRITRGEEVTFGSARGGRGIRVLVTAVRFALRLRAKSVMEKRKKTEMKRIQEPGACKRMFEVRRITRGEEVTFGSARGGRGIRVLVTAVRFGLRLRAKSVMEKRKKAQMKRIQ